MRRAAWTAPLATSTETGSLTILGEPREQPECALHPPICMYDTPERLHRQTHHHLAADSPRLSRPSTTIARGRSTARRLPSSRVPCGGWLAWSTPRFWRGAIYAEPHTPARGSQPRCTDRPWIARVVFEAIWRCIVNQYARTTVDGKQESRPPGGDLPV